VVLLHLPVPLASFLVHGFVKTVDSGELQGSGHGATALARSSGRLTATAGAQGNLQPSIT